MCIYKAGHMPFVQCNMHCIFISFYLNDKEGLLISKSSHTSVYIYIYLY